jgi:hypothetical protein
LNVCAAAGLAFYLVLRATAVQVIIAFVGAVNALELIFPACSEIDDHDRPAAKRPLATVRRGSPLKPNGSGASMTAGVNGVGSPTPRTRSTDGRDWVIGKRAEAGLIASICALTAFLRHRSAIRRACSPTRRDRGAWQTVAAHVDRATHAERLKSDRSTARQWRCATAGKGSRLAAAGMRIHDAYRTLTAADQPPTSHEELRGQP